MRAFDLPFLRRRPRACVGVQISASGMAVACGGPVLAAGPEPPASRMALRFAVSASSNARSDGELKELVSRLGAAGAKAALVLAPESYFLMLIERPKVNDEDLRDTVRWRIQEYIDFPADEAVVDCFAFPRSALRGAPAKVFVTAVSRSRLSALVDRVDAAGLEPVCVDVTELALRNLAWRANLNPDHGIGVLRITATDAVIDVCRGHELFLSRRIADVPAALDDRAWDGFKDALLLQVQRSIDYYESALGQPPASALLVAAAGAWHAKIIAHLGDMLPMPVRSLGDILAERYSLSVVDGDSAPLQPHAIAPVQIDALTHALPALGGLLRLVDMAEDVAEDRS